MRRPHGCTNEAGQVEELLLRPVDPRDRGALRQMFQRCSPESNYRRFNSPRRDPPAGYLDQVLSGCSRHDALVGALTPHEEKTCTSEREDSVLIALGSASLVTDALAATVEIGLIVQDDWQRRGIGSALLQRLADRARERGVTDLRVQLRFEDRRLLAALRRRFGQPRVAQHGDVYTAEFSLIPSDCTAGLPVILTAAANPSFASTAAARGR